MCAGVMGVGGAGLAGGGWVLYVCMCVYGGYFGGECR